MIEDALRYLYKFAPTSRRRAEEALRLRSFFNTLSPGRKSTLLAGPFVGEFGWEVAQWQGYVRYLSSFYSRTVVVSRIENQYLYHDIASKFIAHDPGSYQTDFYHCKDSAPFDLSEFDEVDHLDPSVVGSNLPGFLIQNFIVYGQTSSTKTKFDVVVHGRNIPSSGFLKAKATRNWPLEHWEVLAKMLLASGLTVAAIGVPELSICPSGVVDLRHRSLQEQCEVLNNCGVCVGPSSGAMHLASHCAAPVVVWTDRSSGSIFGGVANRYLFAWNPHATDAVVLLDENWNPSPALIFDETIKLLDAKTQGIRFHKIVEG